MDFKPDTKIALSAIFWIPAIAVGAIIGIIVYGFINGFTSFNAIDDWFQKSTLLKDKMYRDAAKKLGHKRKP